MKRHCVLVAAFLAGCGGGEPASDSAAVRGVSDDTIVVGTHNDMSGPLAMWGVELVNGIRMRFDEVNAEGGVHGRKLELIVEDSQYQVPMAVRAANKLINADNIFVMLGAIGTPHNNAVMDRQFEAGVPNLFPLSAAVSMYEPLHPMKFGYYVSYRDSARAAVQYMVEKEGVEKTCLQVIANDYGEENRIGYQQAVDELGLTSVYAGSHKNTETDFVGTAASIKASGCELLILAPLIKDSILLYSELRGAGWEGIVVGNLASYFPDIAKANDGAMNDFYVATSLRIPNFEDEKGTWVGSWYDKYVATYGSPPAAQAVTGYVKAELLIQGLEAAGRDLTAESLIKGLETIKDYRDPFGAPPVSFSATKHTGGDSLNLYQVVDGKWQTIEAGVPY
ncbi:MAG: ABC transporter substrate-binding protein [Pseudomonadota bacterium]